MEISVYAKHSLENIYNQCCKSYVCYLEYIEQLDKTNLANNLYISDISIFVYKLTLGDFVILNNEYGNEEKALDSSNKDCIDLVVKMWNTLLVWNSDMSFNARFAICNTHLSKYAKLFNTIPVWQIFMDYLGIIQEKWAMDENVYFAFLNEYYRRVCKLQSANKLPEHSDMSEKILLFCAQYHLEDKPPEENIRSIVNKWL